MCVGTAHALWGGQDEKELAPWETGEPTESYKGIKFRGKIPLTAGWEFGPKVKISFITTCDKYYRY